MANKFRKYETLSWLLVGLSAAAFTVGCTGHATQSAQAGGPAGMPVKVLEAKAVPVNDSSDYVATVKSRDSAVIMPQVEGQITHIFVHSGDAVVAPSTTRRLIDRFAPLFPAGDSPAVPGLVLLTTREREVLAHVAQGLSNAEIAQRLYVSEATVKTHVGRVLAKLGLRDRVQAVVFAYETGLVRAGGTG